MKRQAQLGSGQVKLAQVYVKPVTQESVNDCQLLPTNSSIEVIDQAEESKALMPEPVVLRTPEQQRITEDNDSSKTKEEEFVSSAVKKYASSSYSKDRLRDSQNDSSNFSSHNS